MLNKTILALFLSICFSALYAQNKEDLVRKSFEDYKSAILNDKGDEAVTYVDSRTIKYYSDMLEHIKNSDSTKVDALGLLDKLMVFSIRHRAAKAEILKFDGKGLFVYAIKEGMVGKNSVMNLSIGNVEIEGDLAKGQLVAQGQASPINFDFHKEDGNWKVDLTSIFSVGLTSFKQIQVNSGQSENEFLFGLLEMVTGTKPDKEIWNKVQ